MWLCLLPSQILLKLNRGTLKLSKWMCLFVLCLQCSHQTFQLIVKLAVSALLKFNLEKKPNKRWNFWNILTEDQVDLRWSKSPRQNLLMIIKSWRNGHWTFLLSMWLFTISIANDTKQNNVNILDGNLVSQLPLHCASLTEYISLYKYSIHQNLINKKKLFIWFRCCLLHSPLFLPYYSLFPVLVIT